MKLLLQAWRANDLYDWTIAAAIVAGVVLATLVIKYAALRVVTVLSRRTATPIVGFLAQAIAATKIWLLFPVAIYAGASVVDLPRKLEQLVDTVVVVALMAQAALWANRIIRGSFERQIARWRGVDGEAVTTLALLGVAARVAIWVITGLLVLNHLRFDITALIAGLGIGGVAVALAVQNILGDLFASLSIALDKPFVVGDFVVVGELRGTVEHIGLKTTHVRSLDGELIVFSNADLLQSRIRNYKRMYERRVLFTLGVIYQTPVEKLERIPGLLRAAIAARSGTRFDRAHFKEYGDSALIFEAVYYVLDPDYTVYMDIQQAVNLEVLRAFAREGIEFAYPTRTVHLNQATVAPA